MGAEHANRQGDGSAPEDVPSIEEAREALSIKRDPTVTELLKQHVSKAVCNACHKEIDPLGLGLENFAQFGDWRTQYPDKAPVVASGVMPNGKAFQIAARDEGAVTRIVCR